MFYCYFSIEHNSYDTLSDVAVNRYRTNPYLDSEVNTNLLVIETFYTTYIIHNFTAWNDTT